MNPYERTTMNTKHIAQTIALRIIFPKKKTVKRPATELKFDALFNFIPN